MENLKDHYKKTFTYESFDKAEAILVFLVSCDDKTITPVKKDIFKNQLDFI